MKAKIDKLADQRVALITQARNLLDSCDDGTMDAENREQFDRMMDGSDSLKGDIDRIIAIDKAEATLSETRGRNIEPDRHIEQRFPAKVGQESDEYRDAFTKYLRFGHRALGADESRALQVGTSSEGGYLAPLVSSDSASLQATIIETIDDAAPMMGLATVVNVSGDITIPTESTLGAADWTAEEAAYNESDAAFGQITLTPYKATTLIKVSEELLADSAVDLEAYLGVNFGRRFGNLTNAAFTVGDGSSKPTGIDSGAQSVATTASATAVTFDELITLYYGAGNLRDAYRRAGTWMFNTATAQDIRKLKDGDNRYLWEPSVRAGEPDTLLGRPVAINDDCVTMATNTKSIFFGDMSFYWVAMRQGVTLRRLDELYAGNGQVGLLASIRVDGELTLSDAVKCLTMA